MDQIYRRSAKQIMGEYGVNRDGLSQEQVNAQRLTHGENVLSEEKKKRPVIVFLEQFKDLLVIIRHIDEHFSGDCSTAALEREFAGSIRVIGHDAGVHVLGELCGMDAAACSRAARDAGILLPTLAEYSREADVRDAVVFHYAGMCEEDIDAAIRLLAAALRS